MGALPARLRTKPRTGTLWFIGPAALLADFTPPNRREVITASTVEDGTGLVLDVEPVPPAIVLAGILGTLDPFQAPDRDDVRAMGQERRCLLGVCPIRI